jgi:hypothetical protein
VGRQPRVSHGRAVSLHVDLGSLHVRRFIGGTFVFRIADMARILVISDGIAHLATLSDIQAGNTLRIEGYLHAGMPPIFVAQRVQVLEPIPTNKITSFGCGGPVTAVDSTRGTVTVTVNSASRALYSQLGDSLTVFVSSGTGLTLLQNGVHPPITLDQVTVGEHARIAGTIDRTQTPPACTATEMTVRPAPTPTASSVVANQRHARERGSYAGGVFPRRRLHPCPERRGRCSLLLQRREVLAHHSLTCAALDPAAQRAAADVVPTPRRPRGAPQPPAAPIQRASRLRGQHLPAQGRPGQGQRGARGRVARLTGEWDRACGTPDEARRILRLAPYDT